MPEFPIVPSRTAMLFFDTLNVYLHPDDPSRQAAVDAEGVIPRLVKMNRACREAGITIFYGQADHRADGRDFAPQIVGLGHDGHVGDPPRLTTRPAAASGTPGVDVIPELAPQPNDYVIKKHRWSTFFQTHLELSLRTAGLDTIMIAGGSTEVGVASTAYSARDRDFNLILLSDGCRSGRPGVNEFFMEKVFPIFARVMTIEEAIASIEAPVGVAG
jgi:nicotinamidase-related amidase